MPVFFEAVMKAGTNGPMTAAWIVEGENAGARALLDRKRGTFGESQMLKAEMIIDIPKYRRIAKAM